MVGVSCPAVHRIGLDARVRCICLLATSFKIVSSWEKYISNAMPISEPPPKFSQAASMAATW